MPYFKAHLNGRDIIGIGVTAERLADLASGGHWWIKGEDVGFAGDILVLVGRDEKEIAQRISGNMQTVWTPPEAKIIKPS